MKIDIVAAIPNLINSTIEFSIMKRARDRGLLEVNLINLREEYGIGKHKQIDDYQYGGGAGMVMSPEPLFNCINDLNNINHYDEIIFLTPDGEQFNQGIANNLSTKNNLLMICGHYKGIDERIRENMITREISIGDYVLSGGELAAAVLVDSIGRLIPGVLNDEQSALEDSFQDNLLSHPVYTRPVVFNGWEVPPVLLSGHKKNIEDWRYQQAVDRTKSRRPDIME